MSAVFWRVLCLGNSLANRCYSMMTKGAFGRCGPGLHIGRGALLIAPHLVDIGADVVISEHVWLNAKDERRDGNFTLRISRGAYIGRFVQINAWRDVVIEDDVMIADKVFISDADHNFSSPNIPIIRQGDFFRGAVRLETGCWIGVGAVILPGVTVGRNSVVAANSVVTHSVPPGCVAAGIPAKIIRTL